MYLARYRKTGALNDALEAERLLRQMILVNEELPGGVTALSRLSAVLYEKYRVFGDRAGLEESILLLREAVGAVPPDHPDRAAMLSNLAAALRSRVELTGDRAGLEESILLLREAVGAVPPDHPDRAAMLSNLERAYELLRRLGGRAIATRRKHGAFERDG
ncbi:hypothetical protein GCM10028781_08360 [Nostocoides australiense]